jgi:hypothetical protein
MKKILIIEDESPHFIQIKGALEKFHNTFDIHPSKNNDTDDDLDNRGYLMDIIINNSSTTFDLIINHYKDIDLFIVDVSLVSRVSSDKIGIDFLNFLKQKHYRFGNYKILITSRHNSDSLGNINFDFDPEIHYVSKSKWENLFPDEIGRYVKNLFNLDISAPNVNVNEPENSSNFFEKRWWITLPEKIEKHLINRFILSVYYIILIATGFYAAWGTISQTKHVIFDNKDNDTATKYLEYVEHIYLYFLPLFIVFSFLSYYKSTIEIKLTGGNIYDIEHKGAMKSLENSKQILLSSILTFTIINIIENVFIIGVTNITSLISYGILLIVLMIYSIIQLKINHGKQN